MKMINTPFNSIVLYDGWAYFASNERNGLYRFNEDICEFIARFPVNENKENMFLDSVEIDGRIYFSPFSTDYLVIYDIETNLFDVLPLELGDRCDAKFREIIVGKLKDYLYFVGWEYPAIIKLDIKSGKIDYFSCGTASLYMTHGFEQNGILNIMKFKSSDLYLVDSKIGTIKTRTITKMGNIYGYYFDECGCEYYIIDNDICIIKNSNIIYKERIPCFEGIGSIFKILKWGNRLYCFPIFGEIPWLRAFVFDIYTHEYNLFCDEIFKGCPNSFTFAKILNEKLYCFCIQLNKLVVVDLIDNSIKVINAHRNYNNMPMLNETSIRGLEQFIDSV